MNKHERQVLAATVAEVAQWVNLNRFVRDQRAQIASDAQDALTHLLRAVVSVHRDGRKAWAVLPLGPDEHGHLVAMSRQARLPVVREQEHRTLAQLSQTVPAAIDDAQVLLGARRFFSGRAKKDAASRAAAFLSEYAAWGRTAGIPQALERITPRWHAESNITSAHALTSHAGLQPHLSQFGTSELITATPTTGLFGLFTIEGVAGAGSRRPRGEIWRCSW